MEAPPLRDPDFSYPQLEADRTPLSHTLALESPSQQVKYQSENLTIAQLEDSRLPSLENIQRLILVCK